MYRLVRKGQVIRHARGVYAATDHSYTAEHSLARVAKRVPAGVICLLTALRFHGLTTQNPAEVWMALPEKARKPKLDNPRLRITRFSGPALTEGVDIHRIEGVDVRIYSAAKTVADCFKYRNKVGIDVAVEALRTGIEERKITPAELLRAARTCRVGRIVRPYLEALQ